MEHTTAVRTVSTIPAQSSLHPPTPPANPAGYGTACTSPANACGVTTTGTIQCNGACSATTAPANPSYYGQSCTLTSAPGRYKAGAYRGPTVPSFDPAGYQLYAQSVSPANFNLTYYFEWSKDGVNWTGDPLPPVGSWSTLP